MFTTKEAVQETTGIELGPETLPIAQMMLEAWIGKSDADITDGADRATLGRALTFQAIYINTMSLDMLQQAAAKSTTLGESRTVWDTDMFAPYMSPWAIMTCKRLSWMSTRSVHTGPVFDKPQARLDWEYV